jgi:hypothetical protein
MAVSASRRHSSRSGRVEGGRRSPTAPNASQSCAFRLVKAYWVPSNTPSDAKSSASDEDAMTRSDNKPEVQHYVPRMLLKNFANGDKDGQVYAFDKHQGNRLPAKTAIRNLCGERNFYAAEGANGQVSIEQALSELEGQVDPVLQRILDEQSLANMTVEQRELLALFVAVQFMRVPMMHETQRHIVEAVQDRSQKVYPNAKGLEEFGVLLKKNSIKLGAMKHIAESAVGYTRILSLHRWTLFRTSVQDPFWISDCPVVMHNDRKFGPYGNIGLALPGIQIYMPLSPTLILTIWESSLVDDFRNNHEKGQETLQKLKAALATGKVDRHQAQALVDQYEAQLPHLAAIVTAFQNGGTVDASDENVTFSNSLQYSWSYRFIMCNSGTFGLAERMSRERPDLKTGLRPRTD